MSLAAGNADLAVGWAGVGGDPPRGEEATIYDRWSWGKRLRRRLLGAMCRLPDSGLFGLTPLRTHIVICGFPASGTTLLQLMVENGLPAARRFGREIGGWRAATYAWRNHAVVISKVPHDLFRLDPLRAFYADRPAQLKVLLSVRDPRDLLTARRPRTGVGGGGCGRHGGGADADTDAYCLTPQQWRHYWQAFGRNRDATDAHVVRYEEVVTDPAAAQAAVERFVGQPMAVPFAACMSVDRPDFDPTTLRGRRPLDTTRVARWRQPGHAARLTAVLAALPELRAAVTDLGYDVDDQWAEAYPAATG